MRRSRISAPVVAGIGLVLLVTLVGTRLDAAVPTRNQPSGLTSCAGTIWGLNSYEHTVTFIDEATNTVTHTMSVDGYPSQLSFSADGRVAALTTWSYSPDTTITHILDGATGAEIATIDVLGSDQRVGAVTISADGTLIYVTRVGIPNTVETLSIPSGTRLNIQPTPIGNPYGILASSNGTDLFILEWNGSDPVLQRYDATTLLPVGVVNLPGTITYYSEYGITRDGSTLWWMDYTTERIYRYDVATSTSTFVYDASVLNAYELVVSPDGHRIALYSNLSLSFLDTATLTVSSPITVSGGHDLRSGGFTPDGQRLYMVHFDYANTVMLDIDVASNTVASTFMSGGQSSGAVPCPVASDPVPTTTTTTTAPEPVVPKVTG